jgi:hypothetical protein
MLCIIVEAPKPARRLRFRLSALLEKKVEMAAQEIYFLETSPAFRLVSHIGDAPKRNVLFLG